MRLCKFLLESHIWLELISRYPEPPWLRMLSYQENFHFWLAPQRCSLPNRNIFILSPLRVSHTTYIIWIQNPNCKRAGIWSEILKGASVTTIFPLILITVNNGCSLAAFAAGGFYLTYIYLMISFICSLIGIWLMFLHMTCLGPSGVLKPSLQFSF